MRNASSYNSKPQSPPLKSMDFFEMDARFSNENAIPYNDMSESSVSYEEIKPFLNRLPAREVDLIELYFCDGKNQKDIAKIFGVTQGAVSSRLARAKKRLEFLRNMPKITEDEVDTDLCKYFDRMELEIIKCMMKTTCQSRTADIINIRFGLKDEKTRMTQVKVRHRFEKCIAYLSVHKVHRPELGRYHHLLQFVKKNLYKLHEVKLPHFDRSSSVLLSMYV